MSGIEHTSSNWPLSHHIDSGQPTLTDITLMPPVNATSDETGLSPRVLWTAAGVLWLVLSLVQIASYLFNLTPEPLPLSVAVISGFVPLGLAFAWFACARVGVDDLRWFHLPVALGLLTIVLGSAIDPNNHSADMVYPMLPMICALVLFPFAHAWPYVVGGVFGAVSMVVFGGDPTPGPRSIVASVVVLSTAGLLMTGQLQVRRALRRNRELSEMDALTGVANVRRLRARLTDELLRDRGTADFALLTMDLDDFKAVNDALGHSTGDRVLIEVARAIERRLAPGEMVARRGGDEFTVLALPNPERSVEALRDAIAEAIVETRKDLCPSIEPAASIGLVYRRADESLDELLARADAALHDQKVISHARRGGARTNGLGEPTIADDDAVDGARLISSDGESAVRPWAETHNTASWQMIAGVFAVFAAIVPLLGLANPQNELLSGAAFALCLTAGMLAGLIVLKEPSGRAILRYSALAGTLVIAAALIERSGAERNAMIDLLILPSMLGFYVAGRRGGMIFAAAGIGMYAYFISTFAYELAVIRTVQTAVVILLVGYLVPHATAQARETADENERLSGVDPLTGLANVRRMNQRLADELDRVKSVGGYVTALMIDLDDFKQVNDTLSHRVGDEVLVAVGRAIHRHMRDTDLIARRGGDEFVAVVAHDGEIDPQELAERIEQEIADARTAICPNLNPLASVGWVTGRPGDTPAELLARADSKEKAAKRLHRAEPGLRAIA